ncbi:MAG: lysine--tRNA ligase [Parcubacteria group bacterium]
MSLDELRQVRLEKLEKLRNAGMDPYPAVSHRTHAIKDAIEGFDEFVKNNDHLILAGRVMARREHGGSIFVDIKDGSNSIQIYFKRDEIGENSFTLFQEAIDIGDFVEAKGKLFKTKKDEKTLQVEEWKILAKSLLPLPEKWHGLQDVEERYRKRYLDLIMNDEVHEKFRKRAKIYDVIREILKKHNFLEVETPNLQPLYGGASARPFKTNIHAYNVDLFLRIAPELYLKRLLVGGYERVFEFTTNFRNEGVDREHNPEFHVVEWYAAYRDYTWNMELCEEIFELLAKEINGSTSVRHGENVIKFKAPYQRKSFADVMKEYTGIDIRLSFEVLKDKAQEIGLKTEDIQTKEVLFDEIFKKEVRGKLIDPIFVLDYPKSMFPLAKIKQGSEMAEVFQSYAGGLELVKAFTELNDPMDQEERFKAQENRRAKGDEEAQRMDRDYIEAMEYGMPPSSGVGLGLDRLTALLTDSHSIREALLFPFMKPKEE